MENNADQVLSDSVVQVSPESKSTEEMIAELSDSELTELRDLLNAEIDRRAAKTEVPS